MKGPEYSKESLPEFALQSAEVEEVLLLVGEGPVLEELTLTLGWLPRAANIKGGATRASNKRVDGCMVTEILRGLSVSGVSCKN